MPDETAIFKSQIPAGHLQKELRPPVLFSWGGDEQTSELQKGVPANCRTA